MLINKGFTMVKIFKKTYFAQCNNDTQKKEHKERENQRSGAKQFNIVLLFY